MDNTIQSSVDIYKELTKLLNESIDNNIDFESIVKNLFAHLNGGKVYITSKSEKYLSYDGRVNDYTIGGSVSKEYLHWDLQRLVEDLTMAFYKNNGGTHYTYTPNLIKAIREVG